MSIQPAKKAKTHHRADNESMTFSPYPAHPSPPSQSRTIPPAQGAPSQLAHQPQILEPPDPVADNNKKLRFFDLVREPLKNAGTYEEFIKLLSLFSKEVIDMRTLIDLAEPFFEEAGLMLEFKDLLGWNTKRDDVEMGPPGSVRTAPPQDISKLPPLDDNEGPSYRKVPAAVSHLRPKHYR
jgi:paired amphipathic helix protein Sin3a